MVTGASTRILLALDGSPSSIQARDLVTGVPWPSDTIIRLVTAFEPPIVLAGSPGGGLVWTGEVDATIREGLSAELERLAKPVADRGWHTDWQVVTGRPANAIVDAGGDFGADLIVLGSRGRGPLTSMLLGSVSAEVVERAKCSVLIARGDRMSRMLIATDGSAIARTIPDTLATWGAFHGVIAETISVAPDPARTFELLADVYTLGMNDVTFEDPDHVDRYRGYADQLAQELTERQIPATATVAMGDPGHEIIEAARRTGSDLVVTGTRGLHGIERLILGSVARNVVVHAPCSVLVIRRASDTPDGTRSGRRDHEQARAS